MSPQPPGAGYEIVDFDLLPPVPCPCGEARRAWADVVDFPGTLHRTEIAVDAQTHYHRRTSETYYVLECDSGACLELDGQLVPVRPGTAVFIRPGTRHRAQGPMRVLILALPKFDPTDEWFDESGPG